MTENLKVSVKDLTGRVALPTLPQDHYNIHHITWSNPNLICACKSKDCRRGPAWPGHLPDLFCPMQLNPTICWVLFFLGLEAETCLCWFNMRNKEKVHVVR